jgi:hypothetical protein
MLLGVSCKHCQCFTEKGLYIQVSLPLSQKMFDSFLSTFGPTDVKPSNVLVNYGNSESRFKKVQLADFGSTVHKDSSYARNGDSIGTPIFRSPEAHLQMSWDTATDIWSFGAMASTSEMSSGQYLCW